MKIMKNKIVLLLIGVVFIVSSAVILTIVIKYNNKTYKKAEKIIEKACTTEGLPLISLENNDVKKYLFSQERVYSYDWLDKLADITFSDNTGMYSMVNNGSIGKYIKSVEIEVNEKKQTYELYNVKNISNDYMVAIKKTDDEEYIGITNKAYMPKDLDTLKKEVQLENSYIEVLFYGDNQTVLYQNINADYICNEFLKGNKECVFNQRDFYNQTNLKRKNLKFIMLFYQKSANQRISLSVFSDGNISIMPANGIHYEFKADIEDTIELLNYVVDNYDGGIYVNR